MAPLFNSQVIDPPLIVQSEFANFNAAFAGVVTTPTEKIPDVTKTKSQEIKIDSLERPTFCEVVFKSGLQMLLG